MKKVLHVIESLGIGGAEMLLVNEIRDLTMFENHVIVLSPPDKLIEQLPVNCKRTVLDFRSYKNILSISSTIKRYINEHDIDIVHSHLYWANIAARLACSRNTRLINTIHAISSEAAYKLNKLTLYVEKFTYKKRHYIVGVSKEVLKDFDKWVGLKGPSSVIYNMVDDVFFATAPKDDFSKDQLRLVAVGNLRTQKNYKYMLRAFRDLPPNVSLDIYGEGALREEIQQEIDQYKLNITLKGHAGNMEKRLRGYDAFLMTSFYEGMPLSLMEAMAMGLPAFVSDIPVIKESGGTAARYFDIGDPANLTNLLKEVLAGKFDLREMSVKSMETARVMARRQQFIKQIIDLYKQE